MAGKKKYKDPTRKLSYKLGWAWGDFKTSREAHTHTRRYKKWVKGGKKGPVPAWPKHWYTLF